MRITIYGRGTSLPSTRRLFTHLDESRDDGESPETAASATRVTRAELGDRVP